jgi:hypothetical protein
VNRSGEVGRVSNGKSFVAARLRLAFATYSHRNTSMLGIAIDALVLMVLLKTVNDEDVGFGISIIVALVASIGTTILAIGLAAVMGIAGIALAALIAAVLLGIAVSALFGVEIKRSFLIGAIFMVVHIGVGIGFQLMFR